MGARAKVRTPVVPWGDLTADVALTNLLTIPDDLALVLGILAAQGPNGPKLVQTDVNGFLQLARLLGSQSSNGVSGANAPVTVTLTPPGGTRIVLDHIVYSYSAAPTAGRLTIVDGAATVFDIDDTGAGQQAFLQGSPGLASTAIDNVVAITLAAAGAAVVGKLFVMFHTINV